MCWWWGCQCICLKSTRLCLQVWRLNIWFQCPSAVYAVEWPCLRGLWPHPCCLLPSSQLGGLNRPFTVTHRPFEPAEHIPDLIYPWDPSLSLFNCLIIFPINPLPKTIPLICHWFLSGQVLELMLDFKEGFSPFVPCVFFSFFHLTQIYRSPEGKWQNKYPVIRFLS